METKQFSNLKYTEGELEQLFFKYSKRTLSITPDIWRQLIKVEFNKEISMAKINELMKEIDEDENGMIEWEEFIKFMFKFNDLDEAILEEVFKIFDREANGYITPESICHVFLALGKKIPLADIEASWKENNENDRNLTYQKFLSIMKMEDKK